MTIPVGTRVTTPLGPGFVGYVRMAPPNFDTPAAYSVRLDTRTPWSPYAGTVFPADQVFVEERTPLAPSPLESSPDAAAEWDIDARMAERQ